MRTLAFVLPGLVALALSVGCGSGCAHGNHHHATGSQWEQPPDYTSSCTCQEGGDIDCSAALTSGGSSLN